MPPKIGYLIDENAGWDEEPTWKFYHENDVPRWKIENTRKGVVRRIVYWEIDDE